MNTAVDVALMGAAFANPAAATSMMQTATVGSMISAQAAARRSDPYMNGAAQSGGTVTFAADPTLRQGYQTSLGQDYTQSTETLLQLASQNGLISAMARGLTS